MSVLFDQLRISDDGSKMFIDVHINSAEYFDNFYLDEITIMTSDKVSETDPESPTSDYIYKKVIDGNTKEISLKLTSIDFNKFYESSPSAMEFKKSDMKTTLFFIYVKTKVVGAISGDIPCGLDELTTVAVIFYEHLLYYKVMNYTKGLLSNCNIQTEFINFILLYKAFKVSVATDHFLSAIKFYNMLFINDSSAVTNNKNCGCYG